jgi:hypothetical protein
VPSLDLRFAENKSLVDSVSGQNLITFTRASTGTFVDSDGVIRSAATNLLLRSEEFDNAAWTKSRATVTADNTTAPNGLTTADKLVEDTSISLTHLTRQDLTLTANIVYTVSIYAKAAERTRLRVDLSDASTSADTVFGLFDLVSGTVVSSAANGNASLTSASIQNAGDGWYRCSVTGKINTTDTDGRVLLYIDNGSTISYTGDGTSGLFIWGAQLEVGSTATTYLPTGATINSAPRFDHNPLTGECLGLLVEEQRVNSIRNNTMVGAVAGTPGTLPTNWSVAFSPSGLSYAVVGTGSTSGIPYVDIQITGTPSANGTAQITFEQNAVIGALSGQTWTGSMYCSLEAGTLPGTAALLVIERSGAGSFLASSSTNFITVAGSLITQKTVHTRALNNASTAFTNLRIDASVTSGVAVDFTLRIGLPQLEQGAFVTSVIPTTGTAATRTADLVSISGTNFSSWYRQDEGCVFAEGSSSAGAPRFIGFSSGAFSEAIYLGSQTSSNAELTVRTPGTTTAVSINAPPAVQVNVKSAQSAGYRLNDFAVASLGNLATSASGAIPANRTQAVIGLSPNNFSFNNGPIARICYWPQRLPNSTLQSITL